MIPFRPCVLIPNYNHSRGFAGWVEKILGHGLPVIVVNDGSNEVTCSLLRQLDELHLALEVLHLPVNGGKGHAVVTGLRRATERGFSHALQIDADGQHEVADLPRMLELSRNNPAAMVCGKPVYDESIPTHRKLSRYINHFWVWVETLSFSVKDSMCGYRVYPIAETCQVLDKYHIGSRMDFDVDILVKMYWENVAMLWLPTAVRYPEGGLSNFRLWADNWLITKMHTRLFFGMLPRIPMLLFRRRSQTRRQQHWAYMAELGSSAGYRLMFLGYRLLGRWFFLLLLHPVTLYYLLSSSRARGYSRQYLQQLALFQHQPAHVPWSRLYAHFYAFGVSAIDKIAAWSGKIQRRDVVVHGEDRFQEILQSSRGAVFIGSHLGNLELCRALGEKGGRFRINAIVFNKNALKFQKIMRKASPDLEMNLIHVENMGIDTAILLKEKIDAGEIVIIVGDRTSVTNASRVFPVEFLGRKAPFAEGPFVLAGLLDCPVYLIFCLKEQGTYHVYLEHFASSLKFPRAERQARLTERVQQYAERLGYYCARAPLQWFNFFDFWHMDDATTEHAVRSKKSEARQADLP
jgi:predicted LPLAT superfamily acyltransferase